MGRGHSESAEIRLVKCRSHENVSVRVVYVKIDSTILGIFVLGSFIYGDCPFFFFFFKQSLFILLLLSYQLPTPILLQVSFVPSTSDNYC